MSSQHSPLKCVVANPAQLRFYSIRMKHLRFTRRSFLKSALIAGAAPLILPSSIWSADTPPSEKINMGFIGMGKQNNGLLGGFIGRSDTRVLAVCDVDKTRREAAKKRVDTYYSAKMASGEAKECAQYIDFRELLARKDIDAVVIATPDHWHAPIAVAAAKAKKDIYCEKPMAHDVKEGRAMVDAVRKNGRVFQVGSMQRSSREFRVACELVRNQAIGKILRVDVGVGGPGKPCDLPEEAMEPGLEWDLWLGPAPKRPYNSILSPRGVHDHFPNWRNYREYGGGGVTDWGAHHYDIAHWGLGYDNSGPVEFVAPEKPGSGNGVVTKYADGVVMKHGGASGVTFFSEKNKIFVNRGKFEVWMDGKQIAEDVSYCEKMAKELLPANAVRLYVSQNHLSDFISSVRSRQMPICDVETGHRTSSVCNLVNQVYYNGKGFKWDPVKEQFVGGTGNKEWLGTKYRGNWKIS